MDNFTLSLYKGGKQAADMVQWYSACLTHTSIYIQGSVPSAEKQINQGNISG